MLEHKTLGLTLPADAPPGSLRAVFSSFGIRDKQGDILQRSAFEALDGAEVPLIWSHNWDGMAVGKGRIVVEAKQAVFDGALHLQTQDSRDAYATIKALGSLQEYSYGFDIAPDGAHVEERDGQPTRVITKLGRVYEISPVLVGAGQRTRTLAIKAAEPEGEEKPFAHEHACRLHEPSLFQPNSFRRVSRAHDGKAYSVIMGRRKGTTAMSEQAYRYPSGSWTAASARAHCASHDGAGFEAASGGKSAQEHLDAAADLLAAVAPDLADPILAHLGAVADLIPAPDAAPAGLSQRRDEAISAALVHLQAALAEPTPSADGPAPSAATVCAGLRWWADALGTAPLSDGSTDEWAVSVEANIARVQDAMRHRAAKRAVVGDETPAAFYDRIHARDARLRAVLGKDD
jgi:HK97 family phage prohead protease